MGGPQDHKVRVDFQAIVTGGPQDHWYGQTFRSLVWADLKVIASLV